MPGMVCRNPLLSGVAGVIAVSWGASGYPHARASNTLTFAYAHEADSSDRGLRGPRGRRGRLRGTGHGCAVLVRHPERRARLPEDPGLEVREEVAPAEGDARNGWRRHHGLRLPQLGRGRLERRPR